MRKSLLLVFLLFSSIFAISQNNDQGEILLTSTHSSENSDLSDILQFENIDLYKLTFSGKLLVGKSYNLTVKEIWDGKIRSESTISNSAEISVKRLQTLNSDVFKLKVISKLNSDNKLQMSFKFPNYSVTREFDAIDSEDYSLRVVGETSKIEIGKKFYLLAYILPYEKNGGKYWCEIEDSGKDIEKWGKEFGIKHYLVFEMSFN